MLSSFRFFLIANLAQFVIGAAGSDVYLSWPEDCGEDALENALLGEYIYDNMIDEEGTKETIIDAVENESVVVGDEDVNTLHGRTDDVHRRLINCSRPKKRAARRYCKKRKSWGRQRFRHRKLQLNLAVEAESGASFQEEEAHAIVENMLAKCIEMNDRQCECALKKYWLTFD